MNLDSVIGTFIAESRELLQQMEDALLQVEQAPGDSELINAIFRPGCPRWAWKVGA